MKAAGATAFAHCGFGFGVFHINPTLEALGWDPPRFTAHRVRCRATS
jgi:hypothetical protein